MWPFNRQKNDEQPVLPEIQEYYQSENRSRRGMALLLGLGTLVATVGLVIGLFFGGRLVYRTFVDRSQPSQTADSNDGQTAPEATPPGPDTQKPAENPNPTPNPTPSPTPTPTTIPGSDSTEPGQGASSTNIPNTGPEDTVAIFVIATILGAGLYNLHLRRRVNN